VLILGESGVGKELLARAIHAGSPWHDEPFVPVDCGSLTPTLIESELFGHARGAFTGAIQSRQGLLASAGQGTVFLDEIGELPLQLQSRLLRALQEQEIRPVGSNSRKHLESRIIASTNQDLKEAVTLGAFRKDLYFRLNVLAIELPPLRLRKNDIPALVRHFIARHCAEAKAFAGVSAEAMSKLMAYDWPGNVRELENCVRRALVLGPGPEIQVKDLPTSVLYAVRATPSPGSGVLSLRELERRAILQALESARGDRLRAAMLLGISKTTIYRKLKEYKLEDPSSGVSTG
jgi:two-component system response regulator HydG